MIVECEQCTCPLARWAFRWAFRTASIKLAGRVAAALQKRWSLQQWETPRCLTTMDQTNILFVPYSPDRRSAKSLGEISQQKHAAREYHRKAKHRRQTSSPPIADDATFCRASEATKALHRTTSTGLSTVAVTGNLGAGWADPFDSLPVSSMSSYAQKMLHYCESPTHHRDIL